MTGSSFAPPPSPIKSKKSVAPDISSLFLKDTVKESKVRMAPPSFAEPAAPPKSDSKPFYSSPGGVPNIFKAAPVPSSKENSGQFSMGGS